MCIRMTILAAAALVWAVPAPSAAQAKAGVRAGVSADPNQFYFGGHVESLALLEHLSFRPNIEVGVGDRLTLVAFNLEFVYGFPIQRQPWRVYVGAGPAANIFSFRDSRPRGGETDVGGGFTLLVGVEHEGGLFAELKVGAIDSPNLKFGVGYNLKR